MDQTQISLTILGMGLVTYLPRLLPIWLLSARRLPPALVAWLKQVPVAVLAAMLFPTLLAPDGALLGGSASLYLWASIPTWLVAWKTRSFAVAVLAGVTTVALARTLL